MGVGNVYNYVSIDCLRTIRSPIFGMLEHIKKNILGFPSNYLKNSFLRQFSVMDQTNRY